MLSRYGKYLLLKRIGLGGMAEIFLAKQLGVKGFEKLVVIKRILDQFASERDYVEMFLDEARIASSLNHPNVVQIFDLGQVESSFFIAMEFIAGHDLMALLRKFAARREALPPELAAYVVASACEGLHYAHTKKDLQGRPLGIVHRDISPSNLLLSYDGAVKVVDFGIAKAASQSTRTQAGTVKGKFSYMSPEQIQGQEIDARSDVFALGVTLYETLVGRRLFKRENELAIINEIVHGQVAPPSQVRPGIPPALDEICLRALEKDVSRRYGSARELQLALEGYLATAGRRIGSADLAAVMDREFAGEHAAYQQLLAELPGATPEQLAALFEEDSALARVRPGDPGSASHPNSLPNISVKGPPGAAPRRRTGLLAAAALAVAAGAAAFFLWQSRGPAHDGALAVSSSPVGAEISLDGERTGERTPHTFTGLLVPSEHRLRLELPGHEPADAAASFDEGRHASSVHVTLREQRPTGGELFVETDPPGATLEVDGVAQAGVTPLRVGALAAGVPHKVRVTKPGFAEQTAEVAIAAGELTPLALSLRAVEPAEDDAGEPEAPAPTAKGKGRPVAALAPLSLTSEPAADVLWNGKRLGRTPLQARLPVGKVSLTFVNAELGLKKAAEVAVGPGHPSAEVRFGKGKLAADVTPWADVYLGEKKLGTTPLAPRELYEGAYRIRLVNSELGAIRELEVKISAGKTTVLREKL